VDVGRKLIQQSAVDGRRIALAQRTGSRLLVWPLQSMGFPYGAQWAFGYTWAAATEAGVPRVTIHNCRFQHGADVPVSCNDALVTLVYAETFIWYQVSYSATPKTLAIASGGTEPGYGDPSTIQKLLYRFVVSGPSARLGTCWITAGDNFARR
jgi:hypothetical protein